MGRRTHLPALQGDGEVAQWDRVTPISYMLKLAKTQGVSLRLAETACTYYEAALTHGLSGRYFPGVIEVVEKDGLAESKGPEESPPLIRAGRASPRSGLQ
jgi:hypothetical protein